MGWNEIVGHAERPVRPAEGQEYDPTYMDRLLASPVAYHEAWMDQLALDTDDTHGSDTFTTALTAARNSRRLLMLYNFGAHVGEEDTYREKGPRADGIEVYIALDALVSLYFKKHRLDTLVGWEAPERQGDYTYNLHEMMMIQESGLPPGAMALALGKLAMTNLSTVIKRRADVYRPIIPNMLEPGAVFRRIYRGIPHENSHGVVPLFGAYESLHDQVDGLARSLFGLDHTEANSLVGAALFLKTPASDSAFRRERQEALRLIGHKEIDAARDHLRGLYERWPRAFNPIARASLFPEGLPEGLTPDEKAYYLERPLTKSLVERYNRLFLHLNLYNHAEMVRRGKEFVGKTFAVITPNNQDYTIFHVLDVDDTGEKVLCSPYDIVGAPALRFLAEKYKNTRGKPHRLQVKEDILMTLVLQDLGRIVELADNIPAESVLANTDRLLQAYDARVSAERP